MQDTMHFGLQKSSTQQKSAAPLPLKKKMEIYREASCTPDRVEGLACSLPEPSCLGSLDILRCCPSKSQLRDNSLRNRMILCFFAICLMWCSSLKVACLIASSVIETPEASDIVSTCDDAYDLIVDEKREYEQCKSRESYLQSARHEIEAP